ncbi:PaaX family transcriptional regulator C-terminal domain-containing protein [Litorivita sp. NS0012-18]|uniref:PaaX family transcriptional regulator C-terminal domain-containing protein n=1 Tax=Litorivita sp. NS0012-18 TaxID=3127655 RepID=UPI003108A778
MKPTPFQTVINHLTRDQIPRVWSFLISVFGELTQDTGARISGNLLRHISEQVGIKPEAMRVAIHRLRKDGWIDSERHGRTSTYFLTELGRSLSASASPRIYSADQAAETACFAMFNPGQPIHHDDPLAVWVSSNVLITSANLDAAQTFVCAIHEDTFMPEWMTTKICDEKIVEMSALFAAQLADIKPHIDGAPDLGILEVAALRVLLIHNWRRIVLKTPLLPDHVFPSHWQGPRCREMVSQLLHKYPRPKLDELEAFIATDPVQ